MVENIAISRKRDGAEMENNAVAVCSSTDPEDVTMREEVIPDNLDLGSTHVAEPDGKIWKRDDVAEDLLFSCAEEAASKATKEMASLLMKDAEEREKRWIESNRMMMENLNGMVRGISQSLEGRMSALHTRMQTRWTEFEKKWDEKIIDEQG